MNQWNQAVDRYLTQLAELTLSIDANLDRLRIDVIESGPGSMEPSLLALIADLKTLEEMVLRREHLIADPSAPPEGFTLREKLLSTRHIDDARLAARGDEIVRMVESTHQRATAMFVCQFHLSQLTTDMIRTLTHQTGSQTYGPPIRRGTTDPGNTSGGSLFNDAA